MVLATCNPKNKKAIKLKKAAQITADNGERTFVETTVAIEFAASWKPLIKSKTNARNMITKINSIFDLCFKILDFSLTKYANYF